MADAESITYQTHWAKFLAGHARYADLNEKQLLAQAFVAGAVAEAAVNDRRPPNPKAEQLVGGPASDQLRT
jgi:hypothetical protein